MKNTIIIMAGCILILALSLWKSCGRTVVAKRHIADQRQALNRVPTFRQIQRMVGAKEDGIIGPNTIALWDSAICTQYAIEAIEKMAKGDEKRPVDIKMKWRKE